MNRELRSTCGGQSKDLTRRTLALRSTSAGKLRGKQGLSRRSKTEYLRSGGAMILIFMVEGASAVISFCMRSAMPENIVVPPESTMLPYRSLRMSTSHFMMELYVVSWMPADSRPMKEGWKSTSGQRKRSFPIVITWPSGSSDFSIDDDWAAVCISCSKSSATQSFSLMSRTISRSAVVVKEPRSVRIFIMSVRSRPARSRRRMACGRAPSMGTVWETPSPSPPGCDGWHGSEGQLHWFS
eukprot:06675_6